MARARNKAAEEGQQTATAEQDVFDEQIAARQREAVGQVVQNVADSTAMPTGDSAAGAQNGNGKSHAAGVERKKFTPAPDPFGVEGIKAGDNRVHLLQSKTDRAWVIRFDKNPNQGNDPEGKPYSKENPHPVIAYLKSEGYRWGFADADGKGGWGKLMEEGHYTYTEHMDAQRVTRKAAEMMGADLSQGRSA